MKQKKIISLPSNTQKIYRQILALMNFMLNLTPQEQGVLSEIIRLNDEYEPLPVEKRAKFILSTEMRKEIRANIQLEEKHFNIVLGKLKKKTFLGLPLISDIGILHPELHFKPDSDGFTFEVNLIMSNLKPTQSTQPVEEEPSIPSSTPTTIEQTITSPPTEYKHDASKAPVIEEPEFEFTLSAPQE